MSSLPTPPKDYRPEMRPHKPFTLPDSIKVIGATQPSPTSNREIVVEFHTQWCIRTAHLSLAALTYDDPKQLAHELAEAEMFPLTTREKRRSVAKAILREVSKRKTIVITVPGVSRVQLNDATFTCYVWGGQIFWFGLKPAIKAVASNRMKTTPTPDGQVKFPHPWPPQIPPGRTGQIMTTRG